MDVLLIVLLIFICFVPVIGILFAVLLTRNRGSSAPIQRGEDGEHFMASVLRSFVCTEHDHLMNSVILYNPKNGASCEIDHILICSRGIFVIETKNRSGVIYGDETSNEWKQVLAGGEIIHTMRSPILQNETHIRFVKDILFRKIRASIPIAGYVVFVQGNIRFIDSSCVCTPFTLARILSEYPECLSPVEQDRAYRALRAHLEKYPVTKEQHLQYIRSRYSDEN